MGLTPREDQQLGGLIIVGANPGVVLSWRGWHCLRAGSARARRAEVLSGD
ncbi:MAG: hypothetical protein U0Y68_26730 [Blastocatellia bacterium]